MRGKGGGGVRGLDDYRGGEIRVHLPEQRKHRLARVKLLRPGTTIESLNIWTGEICHEMMCIVSCFRKTHGTSFEPTALWQSREGPMEISWEQYIRLEREHQSPLGVIWDSHRSISEQSHGTPMGVPWKHYDTSIVFPWDLNAPMGLPLDPHGTSRGLL